MFPFSPREGTPAAKMPQLDRTLVKARAATLRAKGADRLRAHLDGWVGRKHEALVEQTGMARLPDFTEVRVNGGEAGHSQMFALVGHDGARLIGKAA